MTEVVVDATGSDVRFGVCVEEDVLVPDFDFVDDIDVDAVSSGGKSGPRLIRLFECSEQGRIRAKSPGTEATEHMR